MSDEIGTKHDAGKPMFSCIDAHALLELGKVAEHGAQKYGQNNWRHVKDGRRRYWDAAIRHLLAARYEYRDGDSTLPLLAHAAWNCLAVLALSRKASK
jgi:hypothetical protein